MRNLLLCTAGVAVAGVLLPSFASADGTALRNLRVATSSSLTEVVVDFDGPRSHRSARSGDGTRLLLEFDGVLLDPLAPRVVPVSGLHLDGLVVAAIPGTRRIRVAFDFASAAVEHLEIEDGLRLRVVLAERGSDALGRLRERAASTADARQGARAAAAPTLRPGASPESHSPSHSAGVRGPQAVPAPRGMGTPSASLRVVAERPVVVLDPGHGGRDPGATSWTGEYEKDIVLDLARRVASRLRARGDIDVVLTRTGDDYVSLADRREASQRWGATAFVSIHANSSPNVATRGVETWYYGRADNRDTRRLARIENASAGRSGTVAPARAAASSSVQRLPASRAESRRLADSVQGELVRHLGMRYEAVRDLGAKEGPFFVIEDNAAPSVLVEAAFLTHREEGLRMRSEVYREQVAEGLSRGIVRFLALAADRREGGF